MPKPIPELPHDGTGYWAHLPNPDNKWPYVFDTPESMGSADHAATSDFAPHRKALESRTPDEAAAILIPWMKADPRTLLLLQFALTDATWAAAREVVEATRHLNDAYLACGIGMLGLDVVPRLEEAYATPKLKPAPRFQYRHAIVAALAAAASRGQTWPATLDRYLQLDTEWW